MILIFIVESIDILYLINDLSDRSNSLKLTKNYFDCMIEIGRIDYEIWTNWSSTSMESIFKFHWINHGFWSNQTSNSVLSVFDKVVQKFTNHQNQLVRSLIEWREYRAIGFSWKIIELSKFTFFLVQMWDSMPLHEF